MQTLQEINRIRSGSDNETILALGDRTVVNDENTGEVFVVNHKTEKAEPMLLEEQIRESIPVDGEKNETV